MDLLKGAKVIARKSVNGFYYDGVVLRSSGLHFVEIQFEYGEEEMVSRQFVIVSKGAIAVPPLMVSDYVLVMVKGQDSFPCYVPGQVECMPTTNSCQLAKLFDVRLYNGDKVSVYRRSMVKIGKARYNFAVSYILERNQMAVPIVGPHNDFSDTQQMVINFLTKHNSKVEELCKYFLRKKHECEATQKKLIQMMKNIKDSEDDKSRFHSVDGIERGEEVLARWLDDGWYYRCQVLKRISENTYELRDSGGLPQVTQKSDIIAEGDDTQASIKCNSHVIARHPSYYYSYAPGEVKQVFNDNSCSVLFYDGVDSIIEREEIYKINEGTYGLVKKYIEAREEELIGQPVIARDDATGEYKPGRVMRKEGSRNYTIKQGDGRQISQTSVHIFGKHSPEYKLDIGDHCLSLADDELLTFLPGVVIGKSEAGLYIKLVNGTSQEDMHPIKCFWISDVYYEAACIYYKNRNPRR